MKQLKALLVILLMLPSLVLASAQIDNVRLWTAPDHTRLVFDLDQPVEHKVFVLNSPERVVIDIKEAKIAKSFDSRGVEDRKLRRVRHGKKGKGDLRIVLDLKETIRPKSFQLKPSGGYDHRLVVDLYAKENTSERKVAKSTKDLTVLRDVIVAIDAGHGGEDPGAVGSVKRTREKHITLQVAKKLKALVDAQPGMRGVLTRTGDYFLSLRKRLNIARKHKADLFVSIHADAFRDKRVRGSSVYVLSRRGASSEAARWLAKQENSADLVGGVSLSDKDDVLASVLLDLSQSASRHMSMAAASKVYKQLGKVGKVHGHRVQQAGFVVLKSPDIPSMLVETGFISNPQEERKLRTTKYQNQLARAMLNGIRAYFDEVQPPGTILAERKTSELKHKISSGDTLSEIANQYSVSLATLREVNGITNDRRIRVGQVLTIPRI